MPVWKQRLADILFAVQLLGAVVFCAAQFLRALEDVTGVSAVQYALAATFSLFNLVLALGTGKGAETRRVVFIYSLWLFMLLAVVGAVVMNPSYRWSIHDTAMLAAAVCLTCLVLGFMGTSRVKDKDPVMLALLAMIAKAVPQALLIFKILEEGGSGLPVTTVVVGHLTIVIRLVQIFLIPPKGGARHRKWLLVSEGANELSWVGVTVVWLTA